LARALTLLFRTSNAELRGASVVPAIPSTLPLTSTTVALISAGTRALAGPANMDGHHEHRPDGEGSEKLGHWGPCVVTLAIGSG
jgi:hypothetical protein